MVEQAAKVLNGKLYSGKHWPYKDPEGYGYVCDASEIVDHCLSNMTKPSSNDDDSLTVYDPKTSLNKNRTAAICRKCNENISLSSIYSRGGTTEIKFKMYKELTGLASW